MQQEPHGSCGSPADPLVSGLAEDPVVPARRVMVRPDAEGLSTRGDERGRRPLRRPGDDVLRRGLESSGTTAVGPGRRSSSAFEAAELSTSYSSEFEAVEHRGRKGRETCGNVRRPCVRKSFSSGNPMSGSGPSVSARREGEQTVEGVRNPEDGWCRAWNARVIRISPPKSLKGHEPQEGRSGPCEDRRGHRGPNPERAMKPVGATGRSSDRSEGR
jgi:hypothetical protein